MKGSCLLQAFQEARGGVSESFQVRKVLGYLSPFTASAEAMDSSSAISSGVSFRDKAPMFWLKFSTLVVPGWGTHHPPGDGPRPVLVVMECTPSLLLLH